MQRMYVYLALFVGVLFVIGRYLYNRYGRSLDKVYKEVCNELVKAFDRLGAQLDLASEADLSSEKNLQEILKAFDDCAVIFGAYLHGVRITKIPELAIKEEDTIESLKKAVISELQARKLISSDEHEILKDLFKVAPFLDPAVSDETQKNEPAFFEKSVRSIPQYYETMQRVMKKIEALPSAS